MRSSAVLLAILAIGCAAPQVDGASESHPIVYSYFQTLPSGYRVESLFSINADGSGFDTVFVGGSIPQPGSDHPPGVLGRLPTWSPSGDRVAFEGYWSDPDQPTREVPPRKRFEIEGEQIRELEPGSPGRFGSPVASDIFLISPGGVDPRRITNDQYFDSDPDFSPDGSLIAYSSEREGNRDIYVVDTLGSAPRRITENPGFDWAPDWSPDGTRLLFVSEREERRGLYVMNADGSGARWIAAGSVGRWSPDGSRIAFFARTCALIDPLGRDDDERCRATGEFGIGGNIAAFLIDPDGSNLKRAWPPDTAMAPVSSPDGRLIGLGGRPLYPVWSPDGTMLAFHAASPIFARDPEWQDEIHRIGQHFPRNTEDQITEEEWQIWNRWNFSAGVHILVVDTTGTSARAATLYVNGGGHPQWAAVRR